jgi:hypothetical protein
VIGCLLVVDAVVVLWLLLRPAPIDTPFSEPW